VLESGPAAAMNAANTRGGEREKPQKT